MTTGAVDQYDVEFRGVDQGLISSLEQIQANFVTLRDQARGFGADAKAAAAQAEGLGKVTAVASAAGGAFARNWKTIGLSVIGVALGASRLIGAYKSLMAVKERLTRGNSKLVDGKGGLKDTAKATEAATKATDANTKEVKENTKATERQTVQLVAAKKGWLDYAMAAMTAYRTYRLFRDAVANGRALKQAQASTGGLTSSLGGLSVGLGSVAAGAGAAFAAVTKFGGSEKAVKGVVKEFDRVRGTIQATLRASGAFDVVLGMLSDGFKDLSGWISANSVSIQQWTIKGVRLALQGAQMLGQGFLFMLNGAKNFQAYWDISVVGVQYGFAQMLKAGVGFGERLERIYSGIIDSIKGVTDTMFNSARAALELAPDALGLVDKLNAAQETFNSAISGGSSVLRMYVGQARTYADTMSAEAERGIRSAMGAVGKAEAEHEARLKALNDRFTKAYAKLDEAASKTRKVNVQATKKASNVDPKEAAFLAQVLELERQIADADAAKTFALRGELEARLTLLKTEREIAALGKSRATLAQRQATLAKAQQDAQAQLEAGQAQQLERELSIAQARDRVLEAQWQLNNLGAANIGQLNEQRALERERAAIMSATLEDHEREAQLSELEVRRATLKLQADQAARSNALKLLDIAEKMGFVGAKNVEHAQKMQELEARRREIAASALGDQERAVALAQLELETRTAISAEEERQSAIRRERVERTIAEVSNMSSGILGLGNALLDNDIQRLNTIKAQAEQAAQAENATQGQRDAAVKAARDVEAAERRKEKAAKAFAFIQGLIEAAQAAKATAEGIMGNPAAFVAAASHALASAQFFVAASAGGGGSSGGGGGGTAGAGSSAGTSSGGITADERRQQQADAAKAIADAFIEANQAQAQREVIINQYNPVMLGDAPETQRLLADQLRPELERVLNERRR